MWILFQRNARNSKKIIFIIDGPRGPEVSELQGGLVGDADERVPVLLAPPRAGGPHYA